MSDAVQTNGEELKQKLLWAQASLKQALALIDLPPKNYIPAPPDECADCDQPEEEVSFWWWKAQQAWVCCHCHSEVP